MVRARRAGTGVIAFVVLTVVAMVLVSPPGGEYDQKSVTDYLDHHAQTVVGLYVGLVAVASLVPFLTHVRDRLLAIGSDAARSVPVLLTVAITAMACGWAVCVAPATAGAIGGSAVDVPPTTVFTISQVGLALLFAVGFGALGAALLRLASTTALPTWLRVVTAVGGLGAIASMAWLPVLLPLLWGLVMGGWLVTRRDDVTAPDASVPAQGRPARRTTPVA